MKLLSTVFPDSSWEPLRFGKAPKNYWASLENQRAYMEQLRIQLRIPTGVLDKWYEVTTKDYADHDGYGLLSHYNGSLISLLQSIFPEHKWDPLKFQKPPRNYWNSLDKQRRFLTELGVKLGVNMDRIGVDPAELAKWYNVTLPLLLENGGGPVLAKYNFSISNMLSKVFPELNWEPLRFHKVPQNYWASPAHQKAFLETVGAELGIDSGDLSGWYHVTTKDLIELGGSGPLSHFNNSISSLLQSAFPEASWDLMKFKQVPKNHWSSMANQRAFMDDLARRLGFPFVKDSTRKEIDEPKYEMDGWYAVSNQTVIDHGGARLLALYDDSLAKLLASVYPEHQWSLWRFPRRLEMLKNDKEGLVRMVEAVEKALGMEGPEDWRRVSPERLVSAGFPKAVVSSNEGEILLSALRLKYPQVEWSDLFVPMKGKRASK